jgi:hypothetical protein
MKNSIVGLTLGLFLLSACSSEDVGPKRATLLEAEKVASFSAVELKFLFGVAGLNVPSEYIKYNVDVYKLTYRTTFKGEEIIASGIVSLPKTDDPVSMVSYHHGTIVTNDEAPTE